MRHKLVAVLTLAAMLVAPVSMFAQPADLTVNPIQCAATSVHPRVSAVVPPNAVSGQVFFKAEGTTNEYYVDMRKAADGTMWAYLPAPAPGTKSFTYRVVTLDSAGKRASSQLMTISVNASCPTVNIPGGEQSAATSIVVGLTSNSEPIVPTGFECTHVVSYITVSGELRDNDECRKALAGVAQPGAAPVAEGAISRRTVALAALLLLGGGYVVYDNNRGKEKPVSPARP